MAIDTIGDSLRKYYRIYGMENEGPPDNLNVSEILPFAINSYEITLIDKICSNKKTIKQHNDCKELIEKLANSLDGYDFMNEIYGSKIQPTDSEREHMTNGVFWHYLASILDPKLENEIGFEIPIPEELRPTYKILLKTQGSLIFRLYMTIVYMKDGPLNKMIRHKENERKPIIQICKKLIDCDYVRHLRNALSHSTFESTICGIYFRDGDKFETIASPEFLTSLTTWIYLLNYSYLTATDCRALKLHNEGQT